MAFDAGTIIAHLDLDDADFDRKLREDVRRIEEYEKRSHKIRLEPEVDQSRVSQTRNAMAQVDRQLTQDAHRRGGILSMLMGGPRGGRGGQAGGGFFRNLAGAAGPALNNLSPLGTRGTLIAAAAPLALGALPALAAPLAVGGVGALGAGAIGLGARALIGSKKAPGELYNPAQDLMKQMKETITAGAQPLVAPLKRAFAELGGPGGILANLRRPLQQMFAGAATLISPLLHGLTDLAFRVLPLLGQAFRAVAPSIGPLLGGLTGLLTGLLPGLISLLKAAQPAIKVFAGILSTLGRDIGTMLRDFAPVLRQSSVIFKALADVVSALFPIIGRLAAIFAKALAPVFVLLAGVIKSMLPFLVTLGKILAGFAAAVLGDLVVALGALATLLKDLSPSFAVLAGVMGQVFTILENSGVFGILANALEKIAPQLAKLINALVLGLAPILPIVISLLAQMLSILAGGLGAALGAVATALADIVSACPPGLLQAIALGWLGIWAAFKGVEIIKSLVGTYKAARQALVFFTYSSKAQAAETAAAWVKSTAVQVGQWIKQTAAQAAQAAKQVAIWVAQTAVWVAQNAIRIATATAAFIAENAATLGIIAGIALLVAAIIFLATHWRQVWNVIKTVAADVWHFLTHGWGQFLIPQLYLIRKVVEFVRDHWRDAWNLMKRVGQDFWHWIWDDFGAKIVNFMTQTLPNAFKTAVKIIGQHWNDIKNVVKAPVKFVIGTVLDGLIGAFDWIASKLGFGQQVIKKVDVSNWQGGGRIPGYGGGDKNLALVESGEAIVSKETTASHAAELRSWGVPGFQQGGQVGAAQARTGIDPSKFRGTTAPIDKLTGIGKIMAAIFSGNSRALGNAVFDLFPHGVGGAIRGLSNLLTEIPAKLLDDVVGWLIGHGGGRGAWPFPGGRKLSELRRIDEGQDMQYPGTNKVSVLAVLPGRVIQYGGDPGGFGNAYPGLSLDAPYKGFKQIYYGHTSPIGKTGKHVGVGEPIGSTMGPTSGGDAAGLPNWLEIGFWPPSWANGPAMHEFLMHGGGGPGSQRGGSWTVGGMSRLWQQAGGPARGRIPGAIGMAESGGRAWIVQSGQPPGLTGYGLWQITPTSGIWQNGRFGDLLNPLNNARAAVSLYRGAGGFSPWVTYTDGAYRQYMDAGGWLPPGGSFMFNATRRGEAVLTPGQSRAFIALSDAAEHFARSSGGHMGGGMMRDVYLTLPEGSTVAEALREISWLLRTSSQQGYTGVR